MVTGNIMEYDTSLACGGGIYGATDEYNTRGPGPLVFNNIIRYNHASVGGGGISYGHGAWGIVINNTIYGNGAGKGGGFFYYGSYGTIVSNCIFWNNFMDLFSR